VTPEETQAFQAHIEAAAAILFKNTPADQLQDFESLERSLRDYMLTSVGSQISHFFKARHPNNRRSSAPSSELSGTTETKPQ
jgi:hypothetical protein